MATSNSHHHNARTAAEIIRPLELSHRNDPAIRPASPASELTFDSLCIEHKRSTEAWRASHQYQEISTLFKDVLLNLDGLKITSCMCLCLGSISWDKVSSDGIRYRDSAMSQLVAFESWVEMLKTKHPIAHIYVQDPLFSPLDGDFLYSLEYTVLSTPASDTHITPSTFLFTPHGDAVPIISSLHAAHPALMVCTDLQLHRWWWRFHNPSTSPLSLRHTSTLVPCTAPRQREVLKKFLEKRVEKRLVQGKGEGWVSEHFVYYKPAEGIEFAEVVWELGDEVLCADEEEARGRWEAMEGEGEGEGLGVCEMCECEGRGGEDGAEDEEVWYSDPMEVAVQRHFKAVREGKFEYLDGMRGAFL